MSNSDAWLSPPTTHIGTPSPELELSALVLWYIYWWVQCQPLPFWSPVSWMQQATSLSTARRHIRERPFKFYGLTLDSSANIRLDQCIRFRSSACVPTRGCVDDDKELVWASVWMSWAISISVFDKLHRLWRLCTMTKCPIHLISTALVTSFNFNPSMGK